MWGDKQQAMTKALKRLKLKQLEKLHELALLTDKTIKGLTRGDTWQTLMMLALGLAGVPVIEPLETSL